MRRSVCLMCLCVLVLASVGSARTLLGSVTSEIPMPIRQPNAKRMHAQNQAQSLLPTSFQNPVPLAFNEFFVFESDELRLSAKLKNLHLKRVVITGFMAQMEDAPEGAFYLCARPVFADEQGAGTGDIPLASVRVSVRSARHLPVAFVPGALRVTGILDVGMKDEPDGQRTMVRLTLDGPEPAAVSPTTAVRKMLVRKRKTRLSKSRSQSNHNQ